MRLWIVGSSGYADKKEGRGSGDGSAALVSLVLLPVRSGTSIGSGQRNTTGRHNERWTFTLHSRTSASSWARGQCSPRTGTLVADAPVNSPQGSRRRDSYSSAGSCNKRRPLGTLQVGAGRTNEQIPHFQHLLSLPTFPDRYPPANTGDQYRCRRHTLAS